MHSGHHISLVIPCLNEEGGLRQLLPYVPTWIDEIIVVDNGSTDRSVEIATQLGARVVQEQRRGYGRAYKTGIASATGDTIVTMDGDGSYQLKSIEPLLTTLFNGKTTFVSGSRFPLQHGEAMNVINHIGNFALTVCANVLFGQRLRDSQSGMWAFSQALYRNIEPESDGMAFSQELKIHAIRSGAVFTEVPIPYTPRIGKTKLSWLHDGVRNFASLVKMRLWDTKKKSTFSGARS